MANRLGVIRSHAVPGHGTYVHYRALRGSDVDLVKGMVQVPESIFDGAVTELSSLFAGLSVGSFCSGYVSQPKQGPEQVNLHHDLFEVIGRSWAQPILKFI